MGWFKLLFLCFFISSSAGHCSVVWVQAHDHSDLYTILRSNDINQINAGLTRLQTAKGVLNAAFTGALLIKKSGLVPSPSEKLELFRSGRSKLENAVTRDSLNAEVHFLRLIAQENSPKALSYKTNMQSDALFLRTQFKDLDPALKQEVLNYSKSSTVLRPSELHE